jgi:hypothetical protein
MTRREEAYRRCPESIVGSIISPQARAATLVPR